MDRSHDLSFLDKETTYLAEAIYPENRIVVHYQHTGLVLLGAYRGDGSEMGYDELLGLGDRLGWLIAKRALVRGSVGAAGAGEDAARPRRRASFCASPMVCG